MRIRLVIGFFGDVLRLEIHQDQGIFAGQQEGRFIPRLRFLQRQVGEAEGQGEHVFRAHHVDGWVYGKEQVDQVGDLYPHPLDGIQVDRIQVTPHNWLQSGNN